MRILAIRGRNLASLYGDFELTLDRGPIAEAGLFSIAGPTGSGKSTLIDALCLALYCETPRFDSRGKGVRPGRPDQVEDDLVDANDRRNLLSRGTGDGHAEVDFEGMDERRWRARWEVRRARGKADGRFQKEQFTLCALDGAGDKYSGLAEVKRRIVELVGYTFDEFRRAVVLPQFEFRAFLDADANTRAAILERVTGTEIYGRLSQQAHERAAEVRTARDAVLQRAGDVQPLGAAERTALEDSVASLLAARTAAGDAAKAAEADARWLEADAALAGELASAGEQVADARAQVGAAEARRRILSEVEVAEPLRPIRSEAIRTASHAEATARRRGQAEEAQQAAVAARDGQASASEKAHVELEAVLAETEGLRPDLERARELDLRLEGAVAAAKQADGKLEKATSDRRAAAEVVEDVERRIADARAQRHAAADWLAHRGAERTLAGEWARWKALLRDHAAVIRDLAATVATAETWRKALVKHETERDTLRTSVAQYRSVFEAASEQLRAAVTASGTDDLVALSTRVKVAGERNAWTLDVLEAARQARAVAEERDRTAHEAAESRAALDALAEEDRALAERMRLAEARLGAAEEALSRLNAALSLEERRAELREGEPCPLCGATEHPYAHGAPGGSAVAAQSQAVADEKAAVASIRAEAWRVAEETATERQRASQVAQSLQRQQQALANAEERYAALRSSAGDDALPASARQALEAATACAARAAAETNAAQAAQAVALERAALVGGARVEVENARSSLDSAERELATAELELARDGGLLREAEERVRGHTIRRDALESELEPVLGFRQGWREEARADGTALVRSCELIADAHAQRSRTVEETAVSLAGLEVERESARARLEERTGAVQLASEEAEAARGMAHVLQQERRQVLGGRPLDAVVTERTAAERAARITAETSAELLSKAEQHVSAAKASLAAAESAAAEAAEAAVLASGALADALAARSLDCPRLDALLARGPEWIARERSELAELNDAVRTADATFAERLRKLEAHRVTGAPPIGLEEAHALAASAASERERAESEHNAAQLDLRRDDERRTAHAALGEEMAKAEADFARWGTLADLIGSHDGRALRVFAQGLTLDALIVAANEHLATLAPRYQLERVPRRDLDLQVVDGDLGNEVRGVNGLSGGESFLVSLALALGLASLSTRRSQARTLFIDEGFGTLDRDTLEQAMAAIDQLRSGNRTVGVISHVPELHERIGVQVTVERVSAGRSRLVVPRVLAAQGEDAERKAL